MKMTQSGNRIPALQGSWCVITQMLWVNQVLYMGLQLICAIMSHPAFHFEPRTSRYASVALIIISASLPFPCPVSLSCSQSQPRPGCRSPRTWRWNAYLRRLQMRIGNYLRFNTIFQIKTEDLNEILHCYLSGSNWSLECAGLIDW